ncbi:kinase-like domain-containing protein [Mycena crocata]|nr:kinase-like domain-containing protein [Mycena crocata]
MYEEEDLQATQETESTQEETQPLTQPSSQDANDHLWGYLKPCLSQVLLRVELEKTAHEYSVGRSIQNNVVFPGFKISNYHAVIRWNGQQNATSVVTIEDMSSNGTFINGEKIGKGHQRILKDGNEVAFGIATTSREENGLYDYRYIFRDLVSSVVKRSLYNSYDLSLELGKGSFATVYKALHMSSGQWVAVKVIHETKRQPQPNATSEAARSSREINIMETLRHPNICLLREVFWNANGSIDLVLELVEGGDLLDFILKHNGLSEKMAKHLTFQLCQALSYIHGKGITHRDLKPENVLLTTDNPPIVKVADFGLAKIVDSATMLRTMCGTPSYLAPEVVTQQNNSGYDSLVDSWSVGVIIFSMLTNTNPFIESSVDDLRTRIAERLIDWTQLEVLVYNSQLSEEGLNIIQLLLDFDPKQRLRLSAALQHPWFNGFRFDYPIDYPRIDDENISNPASSLSEDVSMRTAGGLSFAAPSEADSVSQGFEELHLNGSGSSTHVVPSAPNGHPASADADADRDTTPPSNTPPGLPNLKKGGLVRRSEVIQEAAEAGRPLIEPSWEMLNYAQSQSQSQESAELYGPARPTANGDAEEPDADESGAVTPTATATPTLANGSGNGKGPKKRMHSELTPLPEDEETTGASSASSPLSSVSPSPPAPLRKKGRSANTSKEEKETPLKAKPRRGAGTATTKPPTTTRKAKAAVKPSDDEETGVTRRSTRAKSGRR